LVADGVVFVGDDDKAALTAYRASDGTLLWHTSGLGCYPRGFSVANGIVYAAAMDSVTALRASDGAVQWRQSIGTCDLVGARGDPAVADGAVYLATPVGVYALNATDGSVRWHYRTPDVEQACNCTDKVDVGGGYVYATHQNSVLTLSATNGTLVQTIPADFHLASVLYVNGTVYVSTGKFIAVRASDDTTLWSVTLRPGNVEFAPSVSNSLFVISGVDGWNSGMGPPPPSVIYALRPGDGSVLWQFQAPSGGVTDPVVG
jgi:outer membrane protein assembly factor BamB